MTALLTCRRLIAAPLLCAALVAVSLTGCDAMGPALDDSESAPAASKQIQGQVTDEEGTDSRLATSEQSADSPLIRSSMHGEPSGSVEGAVVTAASIDASGVARGLTVAGQATTSAEGHYDIEVADPSPIVLLTAEKSSSDFTTKVLVSTKGTSQVRAMPMTIESNGEAEVYIAVKTQDDDESAVTPADVVVHVNNEVAAELKGGEASAADIASAVRSMIDAEAAFYAESGENSIDHAQAEENKEEALLQLQSRLAEAGSAEAQAQALENFEAALANAYANAGASAEGQAKARQTGASAAAAYSASIDLSTAAQTGLQKKAEVLSALATAAAVKEGFENENASQAQLDALIEARTELLSSVRTASNAEELASAKANYRSAVEIELENALDVSSAAIEEAQTRVDAAAESTLDSVLDVARGQLELAGTLAESRARFYADAEAAAAAELQEAGASNAAMGAKVLTVLSGMASSH